MKGVDGETKRRTGTSETEVSLDGWFKGGFGQQRDYGGGCTSTSERVESPGIYVTE